MGKYGPFQRIEIKYYYISYSAGGKNNIYGKFYRADIDMRDKDGLPIGNAFFFEDQASMPDKDSQDANGFIIMNLKLEDFPRILDVLRNEKPVYLWYNKNFEMASINTSAYEPVGEGEAQ
jgi:hypothetical protein